VFAVVALALGSRSGVEVGNVVRTHLLAPLGLAGTFGLCGGHDAKVGVEEPAVLYDCSTLVDVQNRVMLARRPCIQAPRVFGSLLLLAFGALAVGLVGQPSKAKELLGTVWSDFYLRDQGGRKGPAALSVEEWLRGKVWERVGQAWSVLHR
jgi:hypothetical protein